MSLILILTKVRKCICPPPVVPPTEPWYLAGGVSASDCVAAYQAKGAASYAASKINLINPGTFNLSAPAWGENMTEPTWATLTGWSFREATVFGNADALNTGLTSENLNQNNFSAIVKFGGLSLPNVGIQSLGNYAGAFFGAQLETGEDSPEISGYIMYSSSTPEYRLFAYSHDAFTGVNLMYHAGTIPTSGVWAIAGDNMILNDSVIYSGPYGDAFIGVTPLIHIGSLNYHYHDESDEYDEWNFHYYGQIHAIAFYNTVLTTQQVAAITTAMQAL